MNPHVRYTKAPDGVHIAYWEHGEGPPIVYMPTIPFSHVQLELDVPECRKWYERLIASGRTLVRYDARGTGSDRDVNYFTIEACMRDLEATVDALNLDPFGTVCEEWLETRRFKSIKTREQYEWAVSHVKRELRPGLATQEA